MSNRIDFFQSEDRQLAMPAGSVSVFIDGELCAALEPIEIVRAGWPEFSWARLSYNPAAFTAASAAAAEELQAEFAMGKSINIRQYFNGVPPGAATFSFTIFCGRIEGVETIVGPDGERLEIKAADFSANLNRISVYGQRVAKGDGESLFLAGLDSVFNPDGKANANPVIATVGGKSYATFCAEPTQSRFWSYAEAIDYLLCEYLPAGQLHTPTLGQLEALTEDRIVRDLDVTGLNLLEALHRCCERVGLEFKFVPRLAPTGPGEAIVFYKNGAGPAPYGARAGRIVKLNCQRPKEQLSISKTNIARLHSRKSFQPITHKYIGQGDFKVYEATFELVKALDPTLQDTNYDKFSPSTNSLFYQVKDVYRKWCLNEAGDYSGSPYNRGSAFDFSKIFENSNFASRRRRFWPALTTDKQGKSLGYFLEVSFDGGWHWWQYLYAFNNLLDECGIWLSSDRLDVDTWIAALKGVLKFRITTSVVSDERLTATVNNGPVNSAAPVIEHIATLPRQFKFRKVSDQSIFANAIDSELGVPDEVDDSDALYEFVRHWAAGASEAIETADIQTPYLAFDYQVGDRVSTTPESRDLLGAGSDNRSLSYVERVQMDFQKQCTNLKVVRKRKGQL
jgi:hypothetical protein